MEILSNLMSFLGERGGRVATLLKTSLSVMGKDLRITMPILVLFTLKVTECGIYLALLYNGFVTKNFDIVFNLLIALVCILPGRMIIETFVQAYLSIHTFSILKGQKASTSDVVLSLLKNSVKLIGIGLISFLVRKISEHEGKGIMGFIAAVVAFAIKEIWDLVSNFGIPAIVIEDRSGNSFKQKLIELKSHVSEVLIGVIGIDLMAGLVSSIFGLGAFTGVFGGGALGYFYGDKFPDFMLTQFGDVAVNTFPSFLILSLTFIFSSLIAAIGQTTKSIYFTILYSALNHKEEIGETFQEVVANTLNNSKSELSYA